jgi:hypothetical protein
LKRNEENIFFHFKEKKQLLITFFIPRSFEYRFLLSRFYVNKQKFPFLSLPNKTIIASISLVSLGLPKTSYAPYKLQANFIIVRRCSVQNIFQLQTFHDIDKQMPIPTAWSA